jgi:hypothetical protein
VELDALTTFINTLVQAPPSPFRAANGGLTPGALRGREVFQRAETGCAKCHSGPRFTDGGRMPGDSAATLMDVIGGRNPGDRHGKTSQLTKQEKDDPVEYLLQIDGTPEDGLAVRPRHVAVGGLTGRVGPDGRIVFTVAAAGLRPSGITVYDVRGRGQVRLGRREDWRATLGDGNWNGMAAGLPAGCFRPASTGRACPYPADRTPCGWSWGGAGP